MVEEQNFGDIIPSTFQKEAKKKHGNNINRNSKRSIISEGMNEFDHQAPRKNKSKQGIISQKTSNFENRSSKKEECKCPRVLIADDEPFNLIALEGLLQQLNVGDIEKSFHGKEAIGKIESNLITGAKSCGPHHQPYRLIMLDKNMPIMDGVDVAVTFKKWESEGRFNHKAFLVLVTGDEKMVEKHYDKTIFD